MFYRQQFCNVGDLNNFIQTKTCKKKNQSHFLVA